MFYIFYKHVLLLACPWALVTSVWLQQSPFMSWLIHFIWLTIGLVSQFLLASQLAIGLTLSSTSLPERPVNGVNTPPGLVRGWHLRLQIFSSEDNWENRQHGKMAFLFWDLNTKYKTFQMDFHLFCILSLWIRVFFPFFFNALKHKLTFSLLTGYSNVCEAGMFLPEYSLTLTNL